jgi:hypothetical protein
MTIKKQMWIIKQNNQYYTGHGMTKYSDHLEEAVLFDEEDRIPIFEDEGEVYVPVNVSVESEE